MELVTVPGTKPIRLLEWLVKSGDWVKYGTPLLVYRHVENPSVSNTKTKEIQLRSKNVGKVKTCLLQIGQAARPGCSLMELESCSHPIVMKDMCAECGQDLRLLKDAPEQFAQVSMVPNIPELKISTDQAKELGKQDEDRLHKLRKLVLLVDLDQTLIHTTQNQLFSAMCADNQDFFTFQTQRHDATLYTKLRPGCRDFLAAIAQMYELQIVTFGSRQYAHKIAGFVDPDGSYFAQRILSRDECLSTTKKSRNLKHLFPCGPSMVCIIDDRDDVWNCQPNLIQVQKYSFFPGAGDINSPDTANDRPKEPPTEQMMPSHSSDEPKNGPVHKSPRKRKSAARDDPPPVKSKKLTTGQAAANDEPNNDVTDECERDLKVESPDTSLLSAKSTKVASNNSAKIESNESTKAELNNSPKMESNDSKKVNSKDAAKVESSALVKAENESSDSSSDSDSDSITLSSESSEKEMSCREAQISADADCGEVAIVSTDDVTSNIDVVTKNIEDQTKSERNIDGVKRDDDNYLTCLRRILEDIHRTYYEAYDKFANGQFKNKPDVWGIVPFLRSRILYGCCIVLTGVVPHNFKQPAELHRVHVLARQLGATIQQEVTEKTTHLVGGKKGTCKYQDALKIGRKKIHFVSPDWVQACSERWEKLPEKQYPIRLHKSGGVALTLKRKKSTSRQKRGKNKESRPTVASTTPTKHLDEVLPVLVPVATYNPITGKLVKKVKDPRFNFMVTEAVTRVHENKRINPLYSSLKRPDAVIPVSSHTGDVIIQDHLHLTDSVTSFSDPVTSPSGGVTLSLSPPREAAATEMTSSQEAAARTRKPSMAEMLGIGYALSSNDIADMDKEVDDLLEDSDDDDDDNVTTRDDVTTLTQLGTTIQRDKSESEEEEERQLKLDRSDLSRKSVKRDKVMTSSSSSNKSMTSSSEEEFDHMAELLDHEMHYDEDEA